MSYGVCNEADDPCDNKDTPRTIRIAVNSNWDHLSAQARVAIEPATPRS